MKILLDTHAVLWAMLGDSRLGRNVERFLRPLNVGKAAISDVTLLEIAMLEKKRRLVLDMPLANFFLALNQRFTILPITPLIAIEACSLALPLSKPSDRTIVATVYCHHLPLATCDKAIVASGLVKIIW